MTGLPDVDEMVRIEAIEIPAHLAASCMRLWPEVTWSEMVERAVALVVTMAMVERAEWVTPK